MRTGQLVASLPILDSTTGGDLEQAINNLKVTLVDTVRNVKDLKKQEDEWMCNIGTIFVGGNTRNEDYGLWKKLKKKTFK